MKTMTSINNCRAMSVVILAAIALTSCASEPVPTEKILLAKTAISNASSVGGEEFAPLQFKSAKEKMAGSERAMAEQNFVMARQLAEQAETEAQLSGAMASAIREKKVTDSFQADKNPLTR